MKAINVLFLLPFAHYGLAKIRFSPSLIDPATSPAGARALLEKRDTCESGSQCIIGSCCGYDSCAYNCCGIGMDGEPGSNLCFPPLLYISASLPSLHCE